MATRRPGAQSRATATGAKPKDKGTRGGRPEAQPLTRQGRAEGSSRPDSGQGRPSATVRQAGNGQGGTGRADRAKQPVPAALNGDTAGVTEAEAPGAPLWFQITTWALSLAGLGVSTYLTITHFWGKNLLICSDKGFVNCAAVTSSTQSMVFGIFPVAVLGLAFYVFLAALNSPWAWRVKWPPLGLVRLGSMVLGMLFVLYLVFTELVTLREICLWCTSVHIVTFLLFALTMFAVAARYITVTLPKRR